MKMKDHILAALREQFESWQEVLASMSEEEISTSQLPANWTVKDDVAHLWAWQQRTIARMEAALFNREPELPQWLPEVNPDIEGNTDKVNAWLYETYRERPWHEVHQKWKKGFTRLLGLSQGIPEKDLLATGKYPWLRGAPLVAVLLGTYDHHQEHLEKLLAWRRERQ